MEPHGYLKNIATANFTSKADCQFHPLFKPVVPLGQLAGIIFSSDIPNKPGVTGQLFSCDPLHLEFFQLYLCPCPPPRPTHSPHTLPALMHTTLRLPPTFCASDSILTAHFQLAMKAIFTKVTCTCNTLQRLPQALRRRAVRYRLDPVCPMLPACLSFGSAF